MAIPTTYNPGKGYPKEHLAYISRAEMDLLRRLTDGKADMTKHGILSFKLDDDEGSHPRSGTTSGTSGTSSGSGGSSGSAHGGVGSGSGGLGGTASGGVGGSTSSGNSSHYNGSSGSGGIGGTVGGSVGGYGGLGGSASGGFGGLGAGGDGRDVPAGVTQSGWGGGTDGGTGGTGGGLGSAPGYGTGYNAPVMGSSSASTGVLKDLMDSMYGRFDKNPYTQDMGKLVRTLAGEAMPGGYGAGAIANSMINRARNTDLYKRGLVRSEYEAIGDPNYRRADPDSPQYKNALNDALNTLSHPQSLPDPVRNATDYNADFLAKQKGIEGMSYYGNTFGKFNPNTPSPETIASQQAPIHNELMGGNQVGYPGTQLASGQGTVAGAGLGSLAPSGLGQALSSSPGQLAQSSVPYSGRPSTAADADSWYGPSATGSGTGVASASPATDTPITTADASGGLWSGLPDMFKAGLEKAKYYGTQAADAQRQIANFPGGPGVAAKLYSVFGNLDGGGNPGNLQRLAEYQGSRDAWNRPEVAKPPEKPATDDGKPGKKPRKPYRKPDRYRYPHMVRRPYTLIT